MQYYLNSKHYNEMDGIGLAQEVYSAIANEYSKSNSPINISSKLSPITKYLENKGYIITHENEFGDLFAIPSDTKSKKHN